MIKMNKITDQKIAEAINGLVRSTAVGDATLVSLPMVYPSGSAVSIHICPIGRGRYNVSDFAFGYREAEAIGAERSFGTNAGRMVDPYGLEYGAGHQIGIVANADQLAGAIKIVGAVSLEIANKVFANAPEWCEEEMAATLFDRLKNIFGERNVDGESLVSGASNVQWHFAAKVTRDDHKVLFDVVTPHHASVYSSASKFNDISRLDEQISAVTVVHSKEEMGKWIPLLSQVSMVVEEGASDAVLERTVNLSV